MYYRGWDVNCLNFAPGESSWVAERNGVTMNTSSERGIKSMIDQRVAEEQAERDKRAQ